MPKYNGRLLLKTTTEGDAINYIHVNPDTINHLLDLWKDNEEVVRDSIQGFGYATLRNMNVEVLFEDQSKNSKEGKKKSGEFFPYYNNSSLDLSEYGIYTKSTLSNDACLITAIENSNVLSENELGLLMKSVIPRCVNRESLKDISDMFDIRIQLFTIIMDEKYS